MKKLQILIGAVHFESLDGLLGSYVIDSTTELSERAKFCFVSPRMIDMLFDSTYTNVCEILSTDMSLNVIWRFDHFSLDNLARIRNRFGMNSSPIELSYVTPLDHPIGNSFDEYLAEIKSDLRVTYVQSIN